jgi:hypothetical protein
MDPYQVKIQVEVMTVKVKPWKQEEGEKRR